MQCQKLKNNNFRKKKSYNVVFETSLLLLQNIVILNQFPDPKPLSLPSCLRFLDKTWKILLTLFDATPQIELIQQLIHVFKIEFLLNPNANHIIFFISNFFQFEQKYIILPTPSVFLLY